MKLKKFQYAFAGIKETFKTQSSFRVMSVIAIFIILLGIYFGLNEIEWIVLVMCMGFSLAAEIINTSLEKSCDLFSQGWLLEEVRIIKDVAAGGVLLLSVSSAVVGGIIFIPKIIGLFI
jgi:diacylglycerol kinase (ATP)